MEEHGSWVAAGDWEGVGQDDAFDTNPRRPVIS